MTGDSRTLDVEGLANARDLGGLPLIAGGSTPRGVFFRSETVERVSPRGWEQLYAEGIRTVVDLRRPDERDYDTSARPSWLTTIPADLDGPLDSSFWREHWHGGVGAVSAGYYLPHLAAMPERTAAALGACATAPSGGVLIHCAGGRDRTGFVAMLLLSLAGVEPDAIVDDYLETMRRGEIIAAAHGRQNQEPMIEDILVEKGISTEGAFREALAGLRLDGFASPHPWRAR